MPVLTPGGILLKDYIDAAAFKEMILCADAALHNNIQAINDLSLAPDGDYEIYSLQGVLLYKGKNNADGLKTLPRGIYIENGKKKVK